jgi:hypothetical protein
VGLLADDFLVCWYVPSQYFPGTHCGPELKAECKAVELSATRLILSGARWVRPYARLGVGYAWSSVHGEGEDITFAGDVGAPLLQAAVGVDLTKLSFFDVTAEAGVRHLSFATDGVEVRGTPTSGMDTVLAAYLADGEVDFSGYFYRVGVTLRY